VEFELDEEKEVEEEVADTEEWTTVCGASGMRFELDAEGEVESVVVATTFDIVNCGIDSLVDVLTSLINCDTD
jgi:hypothetical protein